MHQRTLKYCKHCNYALREECEETSVEYFKSKCECPQCGKEAVHSLHVDKRNLPSPEEVSEMKGRHEASVKAIPVIPRKGRPTKEPATE